MKATAFIRKTASKNDTNSVATIYFRLRDGKKDIKAASELTINPNHWSSEKQGYKDRVALVSEEKKQALNNEVQNILNLINQNYTPESDSEWLSALIDKYHHPNRYKTKEEIEAENKPILLELFSEFLVKHKLSEVRKKNFRVIQRTLARYELYVRATKKGQKDFTLDVDTVTPETLRDMWDFFENEYQYYELYPSIYETIPEKRTPQPRGKNTLIDCFSRIRTFFLWCFDNKLTTNRPFDKFPIEECKYGTPIYINLEERDRIFNADLSATPQLEIQRDIFIFQTLIGCRVSDLYRMTRLNIVNGAVEYIQKKTKEGNPVTVRVPLNDKAKEILERYKDHEGKLLPFISEQKYNEAIKKIFKLSGVDRIVTILDPLTRDEVKKPLYEVASSHLARRTFIGNIYKKVKDPNLVSALSGHKEGSKAFRRYRDIDEEMKKDLVKLLD
ncbi:tyrosine-type recombinase/integrase [Bacteroides xylanisolvens]|uniref:Transposase n=1 Tax=Parabacteroides merdae TaxID=46503 RepID=A0AA37K3X3_9BACT|nr:MULTISPECIES: site-specific integrase [Bacteroidales]MBT9893135.1 tyrosine-type recombinase/integrase [Bacteroides xylanisolvens]GKH70155.1 transposase [Parabacteroides merdae]